MSGLKINTRTKQEIEGLKHNITMLRTLPKDMLIGIILGINEEKQKKI